MLHDETIRAAAEALNHADALLIGAGAGMGVDSGLPDFRGNEGFWRAYPPLQKLGIRFDEMANPRWFASDPGLAWGFYGHRHHLYRDTNPHEGFSILARWAERMPRGAFVFTSNVDGHFQRAGFESVIECHGSLQHLQCSVPCCDEIWSADELEVEVDPGSFRAAEPHPICPRCGSLARPNILMFGDADWVHERSAAQERAFQSWLGEALDGRLAVIEMGAGRAVPTVRWTCERVAARASAPLIRINPREPEGPRGTLSLPSGALAALQAIDAHEAL